MHADGKNVSIKSGNRVDLICWAPTIADASKNQVTPSSPSQPLAEIWKASLAPLLADIQQGEWEVGISRVLFWGPCGGRMAKTPVFELYCESQNK